MQLLDLPGIIEGAKDGKGRGRQVIAVARTCSLIFLVLDVLKPLQHKKLIEHELEGFGLRLNKQPPNIYFKKKDKGGINLNCMVPQTELDLDTVKSILSEYKIHNADVNLKYDATADDLIDVVEGNRIYIPCIYILNKIDQISIEELDVIYKIPHCVPISAHHRWNFDDLLEKMWEYLKLVRMLVLKRLLFEHYKKTRKIVYFAAIQNQKDSSLITIPRLCCTLNTQQSKIFVINCTEASQRNSNSKKSENASFV